MGNRQWEDALHYLNIINRISSDAITIIDTSKRVRYWSKQAEELYGITNEDIIGEEITLFFKEEDLKLFEIIKTKKPVFNVYHQPRPDKHVLISSAPIYNEKEIFIGTISIDKDITSLVNLNEKLTVTTTQLQNIKKHFSIHENQDPFAEILGESDEIQRAISLAVKGAKTGATILIQGETGVGKELFAQGIHASSARKDKSFISINCGAIPDTLFESEFFGYEKGAFTGADTKGKPGKVEMADGGTLFLDEIATLPLDMQVKLLRVLQENEVTRIGGKETKKINVRVIAATNSNLLEMVNKGDFREDLYYRLNVIPLNIPPLRNRKGDIQPLLDSFLEEYAIKYHMKKPTILQSAIEVLLSYDWPGNIRELRNVAERLVIFNDDGHIHIKDIIELIPEIENIKVEIETITEDRDLLEKSRIINTLKETYGNKTAAAKMLNISRVSLYKKLKKYNIKLTDDEIQN